MSLTIDLAKYTDYVPGETVQGSVTLDTTAKKKTLGKLILAFVGEESAKVQSGKNRVSVGVGKFLEMTLDVADFQQKEISDQKLQFPFSLPLPVHTPGSGNFSNWESSGDISYKLQARATVVGTFSRDLRSEKAFNVLELPQPIGEVSLAGQKEVGLWSCCTGANVKFSVRTLNGSIFCPGDVVALNVDIENNSGRTIRKLIVDLVKRVEIGHGCLLRKTTSKKISRILTSTPIRVGSESTKIEIPLPADLVPQTLGFEFLHFYFLRIRADVPWAKDPFVKLPIQVVKVKQFPHRGHEESRGRTTPIFDQGFYSYLSKNYPGISAKTL